MAFLTFNTGLGCGLILNGQIYRGAHGYAGETGHFRLTDFGPFGCRKSGSFEGFCSKGGIEQINAMEHKQFTGETTLSENSKIDEISLAAEDGDELALEVFRISGHHLGAGLAYLIDLLNPQRIILGPLYKKNEAFMKPAMRKALRKEAMAETLLDCEIVPLERDEDVHHLAGVCVAMQELNGS